MEQNLWLTQELSEQYQRESRQFADRQREASETRNFQQPAPRRSYFAKLRAELNNWKWEQKNQSSQRDNERLFQSLS